MLHLAMRLALASALLLGLLPGVAAADPWTWRDKGGEGPLSIAGVTAGHGRQGATVTVTFDHPLDPAAMGRRDFVIVDVEADGRGKSEAWIYFFGVRGKIRSYYYEPKYDYGYADGGIWHRPNPRQLRVTVPDYMASYGHMFAVGSYSKTGAGCIPRCWDVTPNRGYLIHDWTKPYATVTSAPEWALDGHAEVAWQAKDVGFSRLRRTFLMASEAGTGKWKAVAVRRASARPRARVPVPAGGHVMFQAAPEDWAGNRGRSGLFTTRVPYDQTDPAGGGAFLGAWTETPDDTRVGGSVHTSTAPLDSFSFTSTANEYCVLIDWATEDLGRATFSVGDSSTEIPTGHLDPSEPACLRESTVAERTATLRVEAGRLNLDGYWSGREGDWTLDGRPRGDDRRTARTTAVRRSALQRIASAAPRWFD